MHGVEVATLGRSGIRSATANSQISVQARPGPARWRRITGRL